MNISLTSLEITTTYVDSRFVLRRANSLVIVAFISVRSVPIVVFRVFILFCSVVFRALTTSCNAAIERVFSRSI